MRARTLHTDGEQRTVAIVLSTGDEAMACLKAFAEREHVTAAQFTAIGAFAGELVKTRIPLRFGLDPVRDIQVLCPMNEEVGFAMDSSLAACPSC